MEQSILKRAEREKAEEKVIKDRLGKTYEEVALADLPTFNDNELLNTEESDVKPKFDNRAPVEDKMA